MQDVDSQLRPGKKALFALLFFRYCVQSSVAIACYCACYLAYEHDHHECLYYPYSCTEAQKQNAKVPWPVILVIFACVVATLESMGSAFHSLQVFQWPDYGSLLVTTTPVTAIYLISYCAFWKMPTVKIPCPYGPNNYRDLRLAPETYDCCLSLGVIIAGGIGLLFQAIITIMASAGVVTAKVGHNRTSLLTTPPDKNGPAKTEYPDNGEKKDLV